MSSEPNTVRKRSTEIGDVTIATAAAVVVVVVVVIAGWGKAHTIFRTFSFMEIFISCAEFIFGICYAIDSIVCATN